MCGTWAWADEAALERKIDLLTQKLEAQQKHLNELSVRLDDADDPVFRARVLNYEKEMLKLRNELRQGAGDDLLPGWLTKDLKFEALVRIRYELAMNNDRAYFGINRAATDGTPTRFREYDDVDRSRMQYMLYFGFTKNWGDDWEAGFRLASTVGDATTRNTTLDGYFAEDQVGIDRAWIAWHPKSIDGLLIIAGKFENPLVHTDMIWDSDASPEGIGEKFEFKNDSGFVPFVTLAQLIAEEMPNDDDVHCLTYQMGFNWDFGNDTFKKLTFAVTFYDWDGYEDAINKNLVALANANFYPNSAFPVFPAAPVTPITTVFGNTASLRVTRNPVTNALVLQPYLDAGDFNILNFTAFLDMDITFGDKVIPVQAFGDIAWNEAQADNAFPLLPGNVGAVPGGLNLRGGFGKRNLNDARSFGLKIGKDEDKGDLQFEWKYAYIEANAIAGAFSDSNFGYANREGNVLKLKYMVHEKVSVGGAVYFVEDIYDIDHTASEEPVLQLDVVFKF